MVEGVWMRNNHQSDSYQVTIQHYTSMSRMLTWTGKKKVYKGKYNWVDDSFLKENGLHLKWSNWKNALSIHANRALCQAVVYMVTRDQWYRVLHKSQSIKAGKNVIAFSTEPVSHRKLPCLPNPCCDYILYIVL